MTKGCASSTFNKFILNDLIKGQYGFEGTFTPDAVTAERDAAVLNAGRAARRPVRLVSVLSGAVAL